MEVHACTVSRRCEKPASSPLIASCRPLFLVLSSQPSSHHVRFVTAIESAFFCCWRMQTPSSLLADPCPGPMSVDCFTLHQQFVLWTHVGRLCYATPTVRAYRVQCHIINNNIFVAFYTTYSVPPSTNTLCASGDRCCSKTAPIPSYFGSCCLQYVLLCKYSICTQTTLHCATPADVHKLTKDCTAEQHRLCYCRFKRSSRADVASRIASSSPMDATGRGVCDAPLANNDSWRTFRHRIRLTSSETTSAITST